MKTVTFFKTLMMYAKELGEARLSGDKERIQKAEANHNSYKEQVSNSDTMIIY